MHLRIQVAAALSAMVLVAAQAAGAVAADGVTFPSGDAAFSTPLSGSLYRAAAGSKPAPAVVLLHQCSGVDPFVRDWASWFAAHGYTALLVDSISPRGIKPGTCDPAKLTARERGLDALGALAYLRTLPDVDKTRIAVVGWGFGGAAAVAAAAKLTTVDAHVAGGPFKAAVAFYPPCTGTMGSVALATPLLLLLASDATVDPAPPCEAAVAALKAAGQPADSHTYPRVKDGFDNPAERVASMYAGHGMSGTQVFTRFDAGASNDAHDRVAAFLAQQMP